MVTNSEVGYMLLPYHSILVCGRFLIFQVYSDGLSGASNSGLYTHGGDGLEKWRISKVILDSLILSNSIQVRCIIFRLY